MWHMEGMASMQNRNQIKHRKHNEEDITSALMAIFQVNCFAISSSVIFPYLFR